MLLKKDTDFCKQISRLYTELALKTAELNNYKEQATKAKSVIKETVASACIALLNTMEHSFGQLYKLAAKHNNKNYNIFNNLILIMHY